MLCFDGSAGAEAAIATAGRLFAPGLAVVVTVREPLDLWAPYDPITLLDTSVARLGAKALGLEEVADELAQDQLTRGIELSRAAGFTAEGRIARGKPWRAICDFADEFDAAVIVVGSHGQSRIRSALLGSVSTAVSVHARRPVLIVHSDPES